jgi:hypothetical protein
MSLCLERFFGRRLVPLALLAASVAGVGGSSGGCAAPAQQAYSPPPLVVDDAMKRREWERSVAYYPNGDTVSGHNRFPLRSEGDFAANDYGGAAYDVVASLGQTVALPFTYIFIPPLAPAVYTGEEFGRTYTGMPPMRPDLPTARAGAVVVDRQTLEVRPPPQRQQDRRYEIHGPQGPGDSEFMSSPPTPTED